MKTNSLKILVAFIKKTLWTTPFLCFIFGYFLMKFFMPTPLVTVPSVIGKNMLETIETLSEYNLTAKIISKRKDGTLQEAKCIGQTPASGTHVKPRQTVHIIIAEPIKPSLMPDLTSTHKETWNSMLAGYKKTVIPVFSNRLITQDTCIAQLPEKNYPLEDCTLYVAAKEDVYILPNFTNRSVFEAEDILKKNSIPYKLYEKSRRGSHNTLIETARILEQQPAYGVIISLDQPPTIHLSIEY